MFEMISWAANTRNWAFKAFSSLQKDKIYLGLLLPDHMQISLFEVVDMIFWGEKKGGNDKILKEIKDLFQARGNNDKTFKE